MLNVFGDDQFTIILYVDNIKEVTSTLNRQGVKLFFFVTSRMNASGYMLVV